MVSLTALWLAIVISAIIVFMVSSVIYTVLGYHGNDFTKLPAEDQVMTALRGFQIPPGDYAMPYATGMQEQKTREYIEKRNRGPVAFLTVLPSSLGMVKSMVLWFCYTLLCGILTGYITGRALGPNAGFWAVFQFSWSAALACYALALLQNSIWYGRSWRATATSMFDGVIYALFTALTFGLLWP